MKAFVSSFPTMVLILFDNFHTVWVYHQGLVFLAKVAINQQTTLTVVALPWSLAPAASLGAPLSVLLGPWILCTLMMMLVLVSESWVDLWLQKKLEFSWNSVHLKWIDKSIIRFWYQLWANSPSQKQDLFEIHRVLQLDLLGIFWTTPKSTSHSRAYMSNGF